MVVLIKGEAGNVLGLKVLMLIQQNINSSKPASR